MKDGEAVEVLKPNGCRTYPCDCCLQQLAGSGEVNRFECFSPYLATMPFQEERGRIRLCDPLPAGERLKPEPERRPWGHRAEPFVPPEVARKPL